MNKLVKTLRKVRFAGQHRKVPGLCHQAADEIDRLTAENEQLQVALEGLHYHHKKFQPQCKLCVDAMMIVDVEALQDNEKGEGT